MIFPIEGGPADGRTIVSDRWYRQLIIDNAPYELHSVMGWHYCVREEPACEHTERAVSVPAAT